ncbi:ATP synthase subunit I [Burkholderia sp. Cy-637]|uniref:ATP synthase subunit I n=1 Tax=Burkholderia sp. Cy-637 TaxID=2608327 RepID=UPI00142453D3|nr:ATP synthase subunit I [Burkholderia sp. Cy-637]NIF87356.1 ATP synthase subunit I [Burkholderia sp. Cy-637]
MAGQAPEDRHDDHRHAQQVAGVQRHGVPHAEDDWEAGQQDNNIVPLTRAEAEALFGPDVSRPSRVTPFRVVIAQVVLSLVATLAWWLFSKSPGAAAQSAMLGGAIGWVPSAVFAARLRFGGANTVMGWMFGEALKLSVTIAMFTAVALRFPDVHWVPLLVTYLVALKTYWLALAWR